MAIVKNTFFNFLAILVIFALVGGWWFSGWPQIWQNPQIPPQIQETEAAWWDANWNYKRPISITYSGDALAEYQVKITTDTQNLISNGKMQSSCNDIRILDSGEGAGDELKYWIDSDTCDTNSTVIWVKVPSINGNKTIYMYYGNAAASEGKDGVNTFIFFDDFQGTSLDTAKWTATGAYSVNNGITITTGSVYTKSTVISTPQDKIFEMRARYINGDSSYSGLCIANAQFTSGSNSGSNALAYNMTQSGASYDLTLWGADGTMASYNIVNNGNLGTPSLNTDYIIGFSFYGSSQLSYFYQNTSYADVNRLTYNGTWNQAFYLWLGYFTGSTAGSTDIDDINARWVRVRQYSSVVPATEVGSEQFNADVFVLSGGTQTASLNIPSVNQYVGGNFAIINASSTSINVTGIIITEHGTVNAQTNLANIKLYYDLDISDPYNCASESYAGNESQFGATTSFNGADGTASFTDSVEISTTAVMCVYVVLDVGSGASNNETLEIKINNPSTEVTVSSGIVIPNSALEITGTTILSAPAQLQQIHFRWRNNDGGEGNIPSWWDSGWTYRKEITIDSTKVDDDLTNFPVLINISSDSNLSSHAQSDGDDIAFTDSSGTKLDHEIEKYASSTGELVAWVEVPSLASTTDTKIYMYYGNAASGNQQNATGTWNSDYLGVWHLKETPNVDPYAHDSTANNRHGTFSADMTSADQVATGPIAGSLEFDGSNDYIDITVTTGETLTISTWALLTGTNDMLWCLNNAGTGGPDLFFQSNTGIIALNTWDGWNNPFCNGPGAGWHLYTTVIQSGNTKLYIDGNLCGTANYKNPAKTSFAISSSNGYDWTGGIDEMRLFNGAQIQGWITTEFKNQSSPSTFYSIGTEETEDAGATWTTEEDIGLTGFAKATTTRLRFEISNEGGQAISNVQYRLEVSEPNPSDCASGVYERISTDADWQMADSAYITDGEASSNIIPGLTDENTTFVSGQLKDTGDETSGITLTNTQFTEIEYAISATASSTDGASYCFRLTNAGSTANFTYPVYPKLTIAIISINIVDGIVAYGRMPVNASRSTLPNSLDDMQTATNDSSVTVDFYIKGYNATGGGCQWILASTNAADQYVHQFCNATDNDCSSPPTNYTALTTSYELLKENVAVDGTVDFHLRLTTPTESSCEGEQSVNVTVMAGEP